MVSNKYNKYQVKCHPLTQPDEICSSNDCANENVFKFYFF